MQFASQAEQPVLVEPAQAVDTYWPAGQVAHAAQVVSLLPPHAVAMYLPIGQFEHVSHAVSAVALQEAV